MATKIDNNDRFDYREIQFKLVSLCLLAIFIVEYIARLLIVTAPGLGLKPGVFQPSSLTALGIVGTIVIFTQWFSAIKDKSFRLGIAEGLYIAFIATTLLSMIFSKEGFVINPDVDLDQETPFHFLAYYWLFYAGSQMQETKLKIKLLYVLLIVAGINAINALLQSLGVGMDFIISTPPMYVGKTFSFGFTHNPNNYGGLACILVAFSSGVYVFRKKFTESGIADVLLLVLSGVLFYTSFTSRARLAIVGDAAFILFFIVALIVIRKPDITKRFIVLVALFALIALFTYKCTNFIVDNVQRTSYELGTEDVSYNFGSQRIYIWSYALESIKNNLLFGTGMNNFIDVFYSNPKWSEGMFTKTYCHNEYLHILATQGIGAFLTYMTAIVYGIVSSTRKIIKEYDSKDSVLTWIFLGMLIAFMGKAIFACSVINVSPYIWTIMGLCISSKSK